MIGSQAAHGFLPSPGWFFFVHEDGLVLRGLGEESDEFKWNEIKHLYPRKRGLVVADKRGRKAWGELNKAGNAGKSEVLLTLYKHWSEAVESIGVLMTYFERPEYEIPQNAGLIACLVRTPRILIFLYVSLLLISIIEHSALYSLFFFIIIQITVSSLEYSQMRKKKVMALEFKNDGLWIQFNNESGVLIRRNDLGKVEIKGKPGYKKAIVGNLVIPEIEHFSYWPILCGRLLASSRRRR